MKKSVVALTIYLLLILPNVALTDVVAERVEIFLIDPLDEPRHFCIDIRGYKLKARIDRGLQAHTCYSYQGEVAVDQAFDSSKITTNQFYLPSFDVCMEAKSIVTSATLDLKECNREKLQGFNLGVTGRIQPINNLELCLTVAKGKSKRGGGGAPVHLIRNLTLEPCSAMLKNFQIWSIRRVK